MSASRFLTRLTSRSQDKKGDDMCIAGIEENVRRMLQKRELAEEIAAKAHVRAFATQVQHGHVHVLVEDQGWVRSVDLLEQHDTEQLRTGKMVPAEGIEPPTHALRMRCSTN